MTVHTFPAGAAPRVTLARCMGALTVDAWDERTIAVEAEGELAMPAPEGDALAIRDARGPLRLRVPRATAVTVHDHRGAIDAHGIGSFTLNRADGTVRVAEVAGEVRLHDLDGNVIVEGAGSLVLDDGPERTALFHTRGVADVVVRRVRRVAIENVGGSLTLSDAQSVTIENVGGNCTIERVAGDLCLANVGGNASFRDVGAVQQIGHVGGSLTLSGATLAAFSATRPARIMVGGNARIELPDQPNLTIHALVGGIVMGEHLGPSLASGMVTIAYGEATARLDLTVGGNLEIYGGGSPRSVGAPLSAISAHMGRLGSDLGRIDAGLGTELGRMGAELGHTVAEHLRQQAHRAAREGITGAVEAVDRALAGLGAPPAPPAAPPPAIGDTIRIDRRPDQLAAAEASPGIEEQRAAILRMVADRHLTPEEGELLLEALESRT